jgi:hypothetical protein
MPVISPMLLALLGGREGAVDKVEADVVGIVVGRVEADVVGIVVGKVGVVEETGDVVAQEAAGVDGLEDLHSPLLPLLDLHSPLLPPLNSAMCLAPLWMLHTLAICLQTWDLG